MARVSTQLRIRQAYKTLKENTRLKKEIERRKITEFDLQMNQQRLSRILDFLDDAIIAVNESLEICFSNALFCRLTGYATGELLGQPINFLLNETVLDLSTQVMELPNNQDNPVRILQKDGSMLTRSLEITILDIEGETLQVLIIQKRIQKTAL